MEMHAGFESCVTYLFAENLILLVLCVQKVLSDPFRTAPTLKIPLFATNLLMKSSLSSMDLPQNPFDG